MILEVIKVLGQRNEEHYTFKTGDEKSLRVVLKGIPEFTEIAKIQEEVEERSLGSSGVPRMYRKQ